MFPNHEIQKALLPYGVPTAPEACEAIRKYIALLIHWNQKVSLTTVILPSEILRFHFGESLFAIPIVPILQGRLADVGSGAGFPGIPIGIVVPDIHVTLIESNVKKATFLAEVQRELKLANVEIFRGRMEDLPPSVAKFDFVTARALGKQRELLTWSKEHLDIGGKVVLWSGGGDVELLTRHLGWNWHKPHLIPGSKRRFLLFGSPAD